MQIITAENVAVSDNPHGVDIRHLHSTPHIVVSQITLEPGEAVKPHKAPVDAVFYVVEGTPSVEIEGERAAAGPGSLVPSASGHVHAIRNESDARARFLLLRTPNPKA